MFLFPGLFCGIHCRLRSLIHERKCKGGKSQGSPRFKIQGTGLQPGRITGSIPERISSQILVQKERPVSGKHPSKLKIPHLSQGKSQGVRGSLKSLPEFLRPKGSILVRDGILFHAKGIRKETQEVETRQCIETGKASADLPGLVGVDYIQAKTEFPGFLGEKEERVLKRIRKVHFGLIEAVTIDILKGEEKQLSSIDRKVSEEKVAAGSYLKAMEFPFLVPENHLHVPGTLSLETHLPPQPSGQEILPRGKVEDLPFSLDSGIAILPARLQVDRHRAVLREGIPELNLE
jgi:hypothetical protein